MRFWEAMIIYLEYVIATSFIENFKKYLEAFP